VVLELIKICKDKTMMVVKQIAIHNAYKVSIAFSPNGEYFSLFRRKLNILQVFKIENGDIVGLMDKVHDEKCIISIKSASEFKFAQKMQFDVNNRYLVSYGKEIVNFIPLHKKDQFKSYLINKKKLLQIMNL